MKLTSVLFVLITVLAGTCAEAQTQGQTRREERHASPTDQACKTEIQQMCQGQSGQQAEQCLKNNQSKLSTQCKGALQNSTK